MILKLIARIENGNKEDMAEGLRNAIAQVVQPLLDKISDLEGLKRIKIVPENIDFGVELEETGGVCGWSSKIEEDGMGCNGLLKIEVPVLKTKAVAYNSTIDMNGKSYKIDISVS